VRQPSFTNSKAKQKKNDEKCIKTCSRQYSKECSRVISKFFHEIGMWKRKALQYLQSVSETKNLFVVKVSTPVLGASGAVPCRATVAFSSRIIPAVQRRDDRGILGDVDMT